MKALPSASSRGSPLPHKNLLLRRRPNPFERSGEERAEQFANSILGTCLGPDTFPQRGSVKPGGLRVIGHQGRTNILFGIDGDEGTIIGIHYGGRVMVRREDLSVNAGV